MLPVLTVSEFIEQINGIIAGEFIVEGEVSQYKVNSGKWIFFDLKDENSVLSCFATVFNFRTPLEDGMKVRACGYPSIRAKSGRFSFVVQKVEFVGGGALRRAYELLKKKLEDEGIFSLERKRPLPRLPGKIGVIASKESAAYGDFKKIVSSRWGGAEIILRNVAVQGAQAAPDIVRAFADFERSEESERPDVIALIRGGGSLEDLAAFNSEEVARAVYASKIPVITGIGHERDVTLAELAADVRASTPSNAAEIVVPERRDFAAGLEFDLENIARALARKILDNKRSVEQIFYLLAGKVEAPLAAGRMLMSRFSGAGLVMESALNARKDYVTFAERMMKNSDPRRLLKKGYSITRDRSGAVVRRSGQIGIGAQIVVELGQGKLRGKVLKKS